MIPRAHCPTPERCTAPKRGLCRCQFTAEHRAKLSAAKLGRKYSPEHRANIGAGAKKFWAANRGRKLSPEHIANVLKAKGLVPFSIPDHLKPYAAKLRANGIRGEALRQAIEAVR